MSNNVYANGNAIACKAGAGKVIAAFPDVCMSPPSPPAGPIPVPYPDSSFSKDMQNGSTTVQINGKEVMLKDKSFYKTSPLGDEAATNSFGANVISHVITGKTYFAAWSMDVKFEGENVDRNLDLTTSNHASQGPPTGPQAEGEDAAKATEDKVLCKCCGNEAHSEAQKRGETITEEEFYAPTQTGLRNQARSKKKGGGYELVRKPLDKGDQKRVEFNKKVVADTRNGPCKDQMPKNPPGDDECAKYYRITEAESIRNRTQYEEAKIPRAEGALMIGHKVPIAGGGCPVGPGNHAQVMTYECMQRDMNEMSQAQNNAMQISADHALIVT
jgi:Toxin PAAR-like domain